MRYILATPIFLLFFGFACMGYDTNDNAVMYMGIFLCFCVITLVYPSKKKEKEESKNIEPKPRTDFREYSKQVEEMLYALDDNDFNKIDDIILNLEPPLTDNDELRGFLYTALEVYVNIALKNEGLTPEKQQAITAWNNHFMLIPEAIKPELADKIKKGIIIDNLLNGIVEPMTDTALFNIKKNEIPVWTFYGVNFYNYKTRREYVGGSTGFSVRIARGFYIRQNAFKGQPVEYTQLEQTDRGDLLITDKAIYFAGKQNIFRLPYDKFLYLQPNNDGLIIQKDTATAKPFFLKLSDTWFSYNLIYNLMKR